MGQITFIMTYNALQLHAVLFIKPSVWQEHVLAILQQTFPIKQDFMKIIVHVTLLSNQSTHFRAILNNVNYYVPFGKPFSVAELGFARQISALTLTPSTPSEIRPDS